MTVSKLIVQFGIALLAIPAVLTANNPASAQQCSPKTTEGRYLVICDGFLVPGPNAPLLPSKLLATVTSDENGTFRSSDSRLTIGGTFLHQVIVGTEVLSPDCTGTITYAVTVNGQPAPPLNFAFVVSENGKQIDGLGIDPGTVFSCRLSRMPPLE